MLVLLSSLTLLSPLTTASKVREEAFLNEFGEWVLTKEELASRATLETYLRERMETEFQSQLRAEMQKYVKIEVQKQLVALTLFSFTHTMSRVDTPFPSQDFMSMFVIRPDKSYHAVATCISDMTIASRVDSPP